MQIAIVSIQKPPIKSLIIVDTGLISQLLFSQNIVNPCTLETIVDRVNEHNLQLKISDNNSQISFTATLGIASLIGIVVNDAILLITFIRAKEQGMSISEVSKESINQRFIPIIVTTSTTVMALNPLSLSGNEMFVFLAVPLIFGLIVATVLILDIVPVLYTIPIKK